MFIKSIEFVSNLNTTSFPESISGDPFSPTPTTTSATATMSTKPVPPPTPSLRELPTCPVCLERMDDTTGLLTILCQHVFHCACLSKWRDSSCPVCRYTQAAIVGRSRTGDDETGESEQFCNVCTADTNLWIWCVIPNYEAYLCLLLIT